MDRSKIARRVEITATILVEAAGPPGSGIQRPSRLKVAQLGLDWRESILPKLGVKRTRCPQCELFRF